MENKSKVWLARDKNGSLYAFSNPPIKCTDHHWGFSTCFILDESIFPEVKWEDDKPTEAYITLAEPQEQPKQEIDWEQRRYEIAKDLYVRWRDMDAKWAVHATDLLINELKKQSK